MGDKPLKIIALQAENIKKLVAVEIRPDGNLVQITGKNGNGKTSVLDSIWWCLAGKDVIQGKPIREGQSEARIRLDLQEIVVTRTFKKDKAGDVTTSIKVESADGSRFPSPQTMLDQLLGQLTFDPLAFSRMDPKGQYDTLKRLVPGVDFDKLADESQADYERRTEVNRKAKDARAAAALIDVLPQGPTRPVNDTELIEQMESAAKYNSDIETRRGNRERAAKQIEQLRRNAEAKLADADQRAAEIVNDAKEALRRAQEAMTAAEKRTADIRSAALGECDNLKTEANTTERKLQDAPALPEPRDVADLRKKIEQARTANEEIGQRQRKLAFLQVAEEAEKQSEQITAGMKSREDKKAQAIAAAKLPVPVLGLGDGLVTMGGLPFDQASDAEQLRVSIAIAMALNPKLRVIRVRDGSLLDEDSLKLLGEMAKDKDYQVWVERVDGSGKVGFVLEDGLVKGAPLPAKASAAPAAKPAAAAPKSKPAPAASKASVSDEF